MHTDKSCRSLQLSDLIIINTTITPFVCLILLNEDLQINIKHRCHVFGKVSKRFGVTQSCIYVSIFFTIVTITPATAVIWLVHRAVAVNLSTLGFVFQRLILSPLVLALCSAGHVNVTTFSGSTDMQSGRGRTLQFYFLFRTDAKSGLSPYCQNTD